MALRNEHLVLKRAESSALVAECPSSDANVDFQLEDVFSFAPGWSGVAGLLSVLEAG
jgi:hypothetical protein